MIRLRARMFAMLFVAAGLAAAVLPTGRRLGGLAAEAWAASDAAMTGSSASTNTPAELAALRMQIQAALRRHDAVEAIDQARRFVALGGAEVDVRPFLIDAYLAVDDVENAARQLQWEVQGAIRAGKPPSEDRLLLLQRCYARLNDANAYTWSLEQLVTFYPGHAYWSELLDRLQRRPDFGPGLALDVGRLRRLTGTLADAAAWQELVSQAQQAGFPAEAEQVLREGLARGTFGRGADGERQRALLGRLAKEASAQRLRIRQPEVELAAARAPDGIELFDLGFAHATFGEYDRAFVLMQQGLRKGGLAGKPQYARLHLGIAYLMAAQPAQAMDAFAAVGGRHGASDMARIWALYARQVH